MLFWHAANHFIALSSLLVHLASISVYWNTDRDIDLSTKSLSNQSITTSHLAAGDKVSNSMLLWVIFSSDLIAFKIKERKLWTLCQHCNSTTSLPATSLPVPTFPIWLSERFRWDSAGVSLPSRSGLFCAPGVRLSWRVTYWLVPCNSGLLRRGLDSNGHECCGSVRCRMVVGLGFRV